MGDVLLHPKLYNKSIPSLFVLMIRLLNVLYILRSILIDHNGYYKILYFVMWSIHIHYMINTP